MADGDFIAGDTLNNNKKPVISPIVHNAAQLNASIERIKSLGIKTVYPGHGRPFKAVELFK
jgi:glyoxylase-like metal-dependent hydrolase (beta-lactamase superfamily II)